MFFILKTGILMFTEAGFYAIDTLIMARSTLVLLVRILGGYYYLLHT